jgi:hypothetical protein
LWFREQRLRFWMGKDQKFLPVDPQRISKPRDQFE